ncbi:MAG: hypothetical protein JWO11_3044 [Nocardioides sp.]|nr:hypothetical protein [Nocardioides sp.]
MPTDSNDLGPMPEPEIEPGEPNPGGPDAVKEDEPDPPASRDLDPDDNPAVEEAAPEVLKEGEDTSTRATQDPDESTRPEEESPA